MSLSPIRCLALVALVTLVACGGGGGSSPAPTPPSTTPTISGLNPTHAAPGATVAITGTNLIGASAVSFNGKAAASYAIPSATEVDAVVPAGATSGTISITTPTGTATSATFTVDAAAAPTITSFTPTSLTEGTVVTLTGTHFFGATQVQFNHVNAAAYTVVSDTQITATAPSGVSAGSLTVTTSGGTATSTAYTVTYAAPSITSIAPGQGPVGTPVVVTGTNLGFSGTTLALNGTAIATFTQSASQINFTVPTGATTGNLVVTTPGGSASKAFTVTSSSVTFDLHVDKVELTQSTQTVDNSVPIVAGKAGLVRVFVLANQTNSAKPDVRITLLNNGVAVSGYPKTVAAPGTSVPMAVDETALTSSWNLAIPATDLTTPTGTGYSILAEADPTGAIAEADKTNNTLTVTPTGTTVPTFKTTIFPVVLSSGTGNITTANKDQWAARLAKMYPIAGVDVAVGAAFTDSTAISSDGTGWNTVLSDLTAKHLADAVSDRYYFGAMNVSYSSGVAGLGWVPGSSSSSYQYRTAIGWDKSSGYADGGLFPEVFAHETGHNMGRQHSPCGGAGNPDPAYPYAGGLIGVWGYDSVLNTLHSPLVDHDIMGYCTPNWVSDYVYKSILTFRGGSGGFLTVGSEDAPISAVAQDCLLVRGLVHEDGRVELLPAFRTRALPSPLPTDGEFTLECQDVNGTAVFSTPLELMDLGCSPKEQVRHFIMALPLTATKLDAIAGLKVLKAGLTQASARSLGATARILTAAPEVHRLASDRMQLTWDASVHPAALVRDADTGEVIAILSGGRHDLVTKGRRFDLVLSDGVTGPTHRLESAD